MAVARCVASSTSTPKPETIRDQLADQHRGARWLHPGVRIPGTVNVFELAVRTIIRENLRPDEAQAQSPQRSFASIGPCTASEHVSHCFPSPAVFAAADSSGFRCDNARLRSRTGSPQENFASNPEQA